MSIRQHSPSCTMILLILRSPCTQPSLSGTRSRKRCRYRLSSSLTPVMLACAAAFLRDETLFRVAAPCGFFYSLRKPFLPACMKTAVLSTAVSLCLRSGVLDVCLRQYSTNREQNIACLAAVVYCAPIRSTIHYSHFTYFYPLYSIDFSHLFTSYITNVILQSIFVQFPYYALAYKFINYLLFNTYFFLTVYREHLHLFLSLN